MKLLFILGFILLILIETFTIPMLPDPFRAVSPLLVYLVSRAVRPGDHLVWSAAFAGGLFFDWFSLFPFGTYALTYTAMTGLIVYLVYRFFTHRSLLSHLLLITIASVFLGTILSMMRVLEITLIGAFEFILTSTLMNLALFLCFVIAKRLAKNWQHNSPTTATNLR